MMPGNKLHVKQRLRGPVVRALGLHIMQLSRVEIPVVLTSTLDLFPLVPDLKPSGYLLPVRVLNHVSFKLLKVGCL